MKLETEKSLLQKTIKIYLALKLNNYQVSLRLGMLDSESRILTNTPQLAVSQINKSVLKMVSNVINIYQISKSVHGTPRAITRDS